MGDPWTVEQFQDHWYSVMPAGMIGTPVPCDCGEEGCHGWRMKVTHWAPAPVLFGKNESGVKVIDVPVPPVLHAGDSFTITTTVTM